MHRCSLCQGEITDYSESLSCRFCHSMYHRACIVDHFYSNQFCPACKKEMSLIDLQYTEPLNVRPLPEKITKPWWPPIEDVPLFEVEAPERIPEFEHFEKPRKGFMVKWEAFASEYLPIETMRRFKKNRKGVIGLYMLSAAVFIAVLAPVLILYDPVSYMADEPYVYHPPTWKYPLGTDVFGRDVFSQIIWGFRSALVIAIPSALLVGAIGTVVGLISGYYGKIVDAILQRINMAFLVWPSVPLVALIVFSWGGHLALPAVVLGVAFTLWPTTARAVRAEVLSVKTRPFIEAARVSGASSKRIVFKHILPGVFHISLLYMTIAVASALVVEATFNFLGLTSPAVVTWGQMLSFTYHASSARFGVGGFIPWWAIFSPALSIAYIVLSFFLISSGLRESLRITFGRS